MDVDLTQEQQGALARVKRFVEQEIAPRADRFDEEQHIPRDVIERLAAEGLLGSFLAKPVGGGCDMVSYGLFHEQIGRACSSVRSLLTVHDMVCIALQKWGSEQQRS